MSTLHEQLVAAAEPALPAGVVITRAIVDRPYAALRAVVELHAPQDRWMGGGSICGNCNGAHGEDWPYPCSTITAIADALGVEIGETP